MAEWSRRTVITLTAVAGTSGLAGCTELFVSEPDPELVEMDQQLSESEQRTVDVTVTVRNQGAAGDVSVTIRALDSEDEPINSAEELYNIGEQESVDVTIPIEAPEGTDRFEALVEPA